MSYRTFAVLISALCAIVLGLPANQASAGSGRGFASAHAMSRAPIVHSHRHHRFNRTNEGAFFWPGDYGNYPSGPLNAEPAIGAPPSGSNDVHYTYTNDVPWDWAHRFPPNVAPSDRPYVSSCPTETLTFPGRDGTDRTVNVTRCY